MSISQEWACPKGMSKEWARPKNGPVPLLLGLALPSPLSSLRLIFLFSIWGGLLFRFLNQYALEGTNNSALLNEGW